MNPSTIKGKKETSEWLMICDILSKDYLCSSRESI